MWKEPNSTVLKNSCPFSSSAPPHVPQSLWSFFFFYLGCRAAFKNWEESQSKLFLGRPQDQRWEDVIEKSEATQGLVSGKKLGCRRRNQSPQAGEMLGRGTWLGLLSFFRILPSYLTSKKYPVLPKLKEIGKAEVCWEEVIQNMAPVSGFRGNKCFCEKLGKIIMIGN